MTLLKYTGMVSLILLFLGTFKSEGQTHPHYNTQNFENYHQNLMKELNEDDITPQKKSLFRRAREGASRGARNLAQGVRNLPKRASDRYYRWQNKRAAARAPLISAEQPKLESAICSLLDDPETRNVINKTPHAEARVRLACVNEVSVCNIANDEPLMRKIGEVNPESYLEVKNACNDEHMEIRFGKEKKSAQQPSFSRTPVPMPRGKVVVPPPSPVIPLGPPPVLGPYN